MIGGGTVGGGVYDIIMGRLGGSKSEAAASSTTRQCVITKICVRDLAKSRSFHVDETKTTLVTDVNSILDDNSIDLVVEVMGGTNLARTVVLESLKRGKSVVTANKALIAEHLDEIHSAVGDGGEESKFGYEAAVCGGIPIISILQSCYTGDIINEIGGICNGTTNFMLCKMEEGAEYNDVLKEAQELGFAEADPTADVEGHDVRAKIAILAKLAFGKTVAVKDIPCMGISQIASIDFEYANLLGCTIKLIGTAARLSQYGEHDGDLSVYVAPKLVPKSHLLASASGAGNAVNVESVNMGTVSYFGPGAGRFPTANSVVADICRIASNNCPADPFPMHSNIAINNDYNSAFYIRIPYIDGLGIVRAVGQLAEKHGVSVNSILQNPIDDKMVADCVVTTEECKLSQVMALCEDLGNEDFARATPLCMPLVRMSQ